ncbi:MAG: DNA polymerase III subunit epsilon [Gammaproteobacteria bacterium]|nr:DNA polymerase III subunit epsilon [Gammaproteobacteria bacterium]MDH5691798.1 DNA polymerase III subunit epsilon [Gammaproteobacteria bacterium]
MRQVVLDTETTGLEPEAGHRIIEIGAVELSNRQLTGRVFHQYLQPDREIDEGALEVHGITAEFLADKPRFADIVDEFLEFVKDAELIIHNAPFDVGFINHELTLCDSKRGRLEDHCSIFDTLVLARQLHPGARNNLDALCKRYEIDGSHRELHGALLDSEILADVYLAMTGGQVTLSLGGETVEQNDQTVRPVKRIDSDRSSLRIIKASESEVKQHSDYLQKLAKSSGSKSVWEALTERG